MQYLYIHACYSYNKDFMKGDSIRFWILHCNISFYFWYKEIVVLVPMRITEISRKYSLYQMQKEAPHYVENVSRANKCHQECTIKFVTAYQSWFYVILSASYFLHCMGNHLISSVLWYLNNVYTLEIRSGNMFYNMLICKIL